MIGATTSHIQIFDETMSGQIVPKWHEKHWLCTQLGLDIESSKICNHDRSHITDLEGDSDRYFRRRATDKVGVLRTINSPFQNHTY